MERPRLDASRWVSVSRTSSRIASDLKPGLAASALCIFPDAPAFDPNMRKRKRAAPALDRQNSEPDD